MAKEFGWSVNDMKELSGHELIGLTKRILDWNKNNHSYCPFLTSGKSKRG